MGGNPDDKARALKRETGRIVKRVAALGYHVTP
jgi:hypothetical protein